MKRLLIITYYWPPAGGSGVQRWLKFVKYLAKNNFHCIVYTPENPEMPVIDNSLLKDLPDENLQVLKTKIFEPYTAYKILTGKSKKEKITVSFLKEHSSKTSFAEKLSKWIRGNCFIPDAKMFWIKPSVRFLSNYLKHHQVDLIISTGPPHSMHLIALHLKNKFPNIPWIADFRDPWTNIDFLNDLYLTHCAKKKHQYLEKKVVQTADAVISISPTLTKELQLLDNCHSEKFYTLTNGFDVDDYKYLQQNMNDNSESFILTYAGLIPPNRNPKVLWQALYLLAKENKLPTHFKVQLIGKVDASVKESIQPLNIEQYIEFIDYLPHSDVLIKEDQANALLLIINEAPNSKGILTGKIFEYLALQKPILAIAPKDGDAAKIIYQTKAGIVVEHHQVNEMKNALLQLIEGKISPPSKSNVLQYSRENLTKQLIEIINKLLYKKF